jgi:hypothetical protein
MRYLFQAVYAITLIAAGAAGSFVWLRQVQPQLNANHAPHEVSWYRAHPDEMLRDYTWCRDNPGIRDPNCAAAAEAKLQADFDAFVKAPR